MTTILVLYISTITNTIETLSLFDRLTVRLLGASASGLSAELLGFATTRVSNQQAAVVVQKKRLDFALALLVNVCMKKK
jgi:hypothetical protein